MSSRYLRAALEAILEEMPERDLEPVEVAVLDSGVDSGHPDLADRVTEAYKVEEVEDKPTLIEVPPGVNNDAFGHGTGVASIITRLAPNTSIVDIKVLGETNKGASAALIEGLRYAVSRGSRLINMSLAVKESMKQSMIPLTEKAYYQNQIIIAAVRNMPMRDFGYPAEFSSCISVDNEAFPNPFTFNYKSDHVIEYVAHGEDVPVAAAGGGYTTLTGTSFATPTITAICALLAGAFPELRPFEFKTLLKAFAAEPT